MPRAQKDEFDKIAPGFLKVLKAKNESLRGWSGIRDSAEFRQLLSSAEDAKRRAPSIPQNTWVQLIDQMMQQAEKQGLQTEVFSVMLKTRDTAPPFEPKAE